MASDWNALLDRLLSTDLTVAEYRLALAVARQTLGYRRRSSQVGEEFLRGLSRITDGRGFNRARAGLIEAGILRYTSGGIGGRGRRSTYELLFPADENPRSDAGLTEAKKPPLSGQETSAPQRARIGNRKGKSIPASPATNITTRTAESYQAAGGSLDLDEWRGTLARQASALAKRGVGEGVILAAASQLGQRREFPGFLMQRVEALEQAGGPCSWEGLDRSRLTASQLSTCPCVRCGEWLAHLDPAADRAGSRP